MRFGIDIAQQRLPFDEIVNRVRFGEELGFDGAWGFDHFVPMYGQGPGECFEGMTTLAALATVTSTIRLGLLVTGVTYRHPSVLAVEAITVDHASHGRLELALGAAWYEPEHRQLGIEFPSIGERFDRLEDTSPANLDRRYWAAAPPAARGTLRRRLAQLRQSGGAAWVVGPPRPARRCGR